MVPICKIVSIRSIEGIFRVAERIECGRLAQALLLHMPVKDERKSETAGGRKARRKAIFLCFTREQPDRVPR